mmetsp:Transcript_16700/g.54405  ORF Transcript_16700/g.54405 Transcript_16700/m.54405 type:complete len:314 (+) Transcript_16700:350-1291(+)
MSASMSLVVLTGAKRVRGIRMAWAPGKHSMAAPIAVSSWRTLVEFLSRGSTVLPFFMTGSGSRPSNLVYASLSAGRLTHRLFVLKNLCLATFWNSPSSSSGHCAASRRSNPPVALDRARWPPFLSASVRAATSMAKGAPDVANHVSNFRSIVAPRLSELETNMYLYPLSSSASSVPDPTTAGYKSPWPGGHHSQAGAAGHEAGDMSDAVTLGALFWQNSSGTPPFASSSYFARWARVSLDVANEFISMKDSSTPRDERMCSTCLAMKSRKVLPSLSSSSDLAFSRPMPVPKPPLSFSITVSVSSDAFSSERVS